MWKEEVDVAISTFYPCEIWEGKSEADKLLNSFASVKHNLKTSICWPCPENALTSSYGTILVMRIWSKINDFASLRHVSSLLIWWNLAFVLCSTCPFAADRRFCIWTMRLPSMKLLLRKEIREYKKYNNRLVKWMRFSRILPCLFTSKELWLVNHFPFILTIKISRWHLLDVYKSLSLRWHWLQHWEFSCCYCTGEISTC